MLIVLLKINMKNGVRKGSVLFFVLCLSLIFSTVCFAFEGKVKHVIDGDTFTLDNNKTVRIASIDTPEVGHGGKQDQYYAREAKGLLERLIAGKSVRIEYTLDHKDRYKRIVGWVYVGGVFVNEYMIEKGAAFFYYHKNNQEEFQKKLLQVQRKAIKSRKGFWPVISKQSMYRQQWVGNKRSRRCFPEGDKFGQRISKRNRIYFSNLGKAFQQGYSPARHTDFWPSANR